MTSRNSAEIPQHNWPFRSGPSQDLKTSSLNGAVDIQPRPAEMVWRRAAYRIDRHVQAISLPLCDCDPLCRGTHRHQHRAALHGMDAAGILICPRARNPVWRKLHLTQISNGNGFSRRSIPVRGSGGRSRGKSTRRTTGISTASFRFARVACRRNLRLLCDDSGGAGRLARLTDATCEGHSLIWKRLPSY